MKRFLFILMAVTVVVLATGRAVPPVENGNGAASPSDSCTGVMPAGPMMGPLNIEGTKPEPVSVPEPVWASILAATAVTLLRRGRSF